MMLCSIHSKIGYKDFACLNGVMIDWERDSLPVRKDLSGQLSGSLLSLYSFSKDWKISFTDDILVALKALLPAKAKPFSKFPLSAFISAMIIQ